MGLQPRFLRCRKNSKINFIYCIRCKKLNLLQKTRRIMRGSPCRDLKSPSPAKRHLFIIEENMSESGGKMSLPKRAKRCPPR